MSLPKVKLNDHHFVSLPHMNIGTLHLEEGNPVLIASDNIRIKSIGLKYQRLLHSIRL